MRSASSKAPLEIQTAEISNGFMGIGSPEWDVAPLARGISTGLRSLTDMARLLSVMPADAPDPRPIQAPGGSFGSAMVPPTDEKTIARTDDFSTVKPRRYLHRCEMRSQDAHLWRWRLGLTLGSLQDSPSQQCRLRPIVRAELVGNVLDVRFHRVDGCPKVLRDPEVAGAG